MTVTVTAIEVQAGELQPGDLFSAAGPEYWDTAMNGDSVGQKVYVRTNYPCPVGQLTASIYRLELTQAASTRPVLESDVIVGIEEA